MLLYSITMILSKHGMNISTSNMERIVRVWFEDGRIHIQTNLDSTYSRPLEAFPRLLYATHEQRSHFEIGPEGDDIHWEDIDEDIHITSFFSQVEPNTDNAIADIFRRFPQLNVSEVARSIGIDKSLLSRYIYGIKKPSEERKKLILDYIRKLGREMASL